MIVRIKSGNENTLAHTCDTVQIRGMNSLGLTQMEKLVMPTEGGSARERNNNNNSNRKRKCQNS